MREHIIINNDRTVIIPASVYKVGNRFDHGVNKVIFDCPRYADDEQTIDLSAMKIYINYIRSDKEPLSSLAMNVTVDETDPTIMHFVWDITRSVTFVDGVLDCLVCIKKTNAEGVEEHHWNSDIFSKLFVGKGMENTETIAEENIDLITQLLLEVDTAKAEVSGVSEAINAVDEKIGSLENLTTEDKSNVVDAVNEVKEASDNVAESVDGLKSDLVNNYLKLKMSEETITLTKEAGVIDMDLNVTSTYAKFKHSCIDVSEGEIYKVTCVSSNDTYPACFVKNSESGESLLLLGGTSQGYTDEEVIIPSGFNKMYVNTTLQLTDYPLSVIKIIVKTSEEFWKEFDSISAIAQVSSNYHKLLGKKVLIMGDSIAYGQGATNRTTEAWYAKFEELTGCEVTNIAIGGSKIQYASSEGDTKSIYTLSNETDFSGYDVCIIFSGTNDFAGGFIGEIGSSNNTDACGALALAIQNIMTSNPLIKIIYFTPMFRARLLVGDEKNSDDFSNNGFYLYDFADRLETVARNNHVPCKNMYREFLVNKYNAQTLLADGLHPNSLGHERLANVIADFVEANI